MSSTTHRRRRRIDSDHLFYGTVTGTALLIYVLLAARLIGGA